MLEEAFSLERILDLLRTEDLDSWLKLWRLSQGGSPRQLALELMVAVIPFPVEEAIFVLDMCCGPGDAGRFIRARFSNSRIDLVDRDPFLLGLALASNRRANIPGNFFARDIWNSGWHDEIESKYHVICVATALHYFDPKRLKELFKDFLELLRPGGVLLFTEPTHSRTPFDAGHQAWDRAREDHYDVATWDRFWSRANSLLGYDHRKIQEAAPQKKRAIGDAGLCVLAYVEMLEVVGFQVVDVLARTYERVTIAALKSL